MVKVKRYCCFSFVLFFVCYFCLACAPNELKKVASMISNYNITANIGEDMTAYCNEKLEFVNQTNVDLNHICFHLYPRAFRKDAIIKPYTTLTMATCFPNGISYGDIEIFNVKLNGNDREFEIVGSDEDILKIDFGFYLSPRSKVIIDIDFNLIIPNCTHRFGYYNGHINLGNWYPIVCAITGGEYENNPYFATGDPFFSDIANYNVSITYPQNYVISSTGEIQTSKSDDKLTSKISALAVRDFALNFAENTYSLQGKIGETTVSYFGYKTDENLQKYLEISLKAVDFFNKSFGNYPYSTLSVVKTPFIYGGMEYPGIVFISDAIDDEDEYLKVIVHEVAHQWWYSVVGNDEVNEAWLDESIAEYSTALFFEENTSYGISYNDLVKNAISSYSLYVDVIQTIRGEVNTKMDLPINKYQNDYEYSYMVYVKGVIMFDELKNAVGEKKIISGLKKYYLSNKFKIATKKEFFKAFNSACHKDLEQFFEGYLNGTTIITNIS